MKKPVFILGSHKSGTTLLRSLLDNTPELFTIPIESHIFEHLGYWVNYALRQQPPKEVSVEEVLNRIVSAINTSNKKTSQYTKFGDDGLPKNAWDVDLFSKKLNAYCSEELRQGNISKFIFGYFKSIYWSLINEKPPEEQRFVEKSVENAEFANLLNSLIVDCKFIHIVRNPYANLVSIRKYVQLRKVYPFLGTIVQAMENNYYYASMNSKTLSQYKVLRYEDLVLNTEREMRSISDFIEVPFHANMLSPTILGNPWKGNSVSGKSFESVSSDPIHRWEKTINPIEIFTVNLFFDHILDTFNYSQIPYASIPLRPNKFENIRTYFANRFYLLTSLKVKNSYK